MLLLASFAYATNVNVDITLPPEAQQAGLNEADLEKALTDAIGSQLHTVDMKPYMDQMANANILSAKGLGVDYASDMQRFAVGGGFGTAVNGAGFAFTAGDSALPEAGFALQIGAMAGLNLGAFSDKDSALRRFKIYVNGMMADTRRDPFRASFLNYGGHLQVKLIKGGDKTDGVRWGGFDLTTGYEFSSYTLTLDDDLPVETDNISWDANGHVTILARSQSVPLELSTNLHIFVVTAFLGVGADYNVSGVADAEIGVDGPITVSYDGKTADVGSASVTLDEMGTAAAFTPRAFAGAQVDIFFVKVYGQLNVTLDESVGGHVGLRVVL